jgi:hypothetical protein
VIKHIRIRNFRSLHDVAVDLDPLTVLIGRSGTGKSNFVRAIRFLRDQLIPSHGGALIQAPPNITPANNPGGRLGYHVRLRVPGFGADLEYTLTFRPGPFPVGGSVPEEEALRHGDTVIFHQSGGKWVTPPAITPAPPPGQLLLGRLAGLRPATVAYVALTTGIGCYDFPGNVLQPPATGPTTRSGYADSGWNYLAVAEAISNNLERLTDWAEVGRALGTLNRSVRGVDLHLPERDRIEVAHEIGGKLLLLDVAQESEGFRRFFAHLLALYQTPPKQTVIFEHPESGIHPGALATLFEEFEDYVRDRPDRKARGQVILTTHSPQLLDHFRPENIRVVDIEGGVTRIGRLATDQADSIRKHLMFPRELLTAEEPQIDQPLAGVAG